MKFGILVFPGSNCDHDAYHAVAQVGGYDATFLWHASTDLERSDAIIVPGGFAYGDYLRTGAIAKFAPIMQSVRQFAASGGLVLGICNGFQILCEAGLLPGALMRNASGRYLCKYLHLRAETDDSPFLQGVAKGSLLRMPVGHMEGNYFCDSQTLKRLNDEDRVAFRYASAQGSVEAEHNANGSVENIAGILNEGRNVLGLMPHPDRSSEDLLGSPDGLFLFQSMAAAISQGALA